jgi:hypothetical protein
MNQGAENINPVQVTEVLGTGAEAHRLAVVGEWTFMVREADRDREPMIPDADLAERIGLPIHKFRQLSGRHERAGNINPFAVSTTVGQNGGRPGKQRFYDEADALFIVSRSETPKAIALTKEMIRVFMLARRGLMPMAPSVDSAVGAALALVPGLVAQLEAYRADLGAMRAEIGTLRGELATGVIGAEVAKAEVLRPLARVAALYATPVRKVKAARRSLENRLRAILGFVGPGSAWSMLPRRLLDVAQRQLTMWLDEAIAARAVALRSSQTDLFAKN